MTCGEGIKISKNIRKIRLNILFINLFVPMMKNNKKMMQVILQLLQKFTRFTKDQKGFIVYLAVLAFFVLLFPIIHVSDIANSEITGYSIWLIGNTFFKTAVFVVLVLGILLGWNISFRFKNLMIRYFGFRNDDNLINFFLLWIVVIAFFGITDTLSVVNGVTSRISLTFWAHLIQIILLVGLVFNLWFVIKDAKNNGKKAKIITMQDQDEHTHELQEKDKEQLRGLFSNK